MRCAAFDGINLDWNWRKKINEIINKLVTSKIQKSIICKKYSNYRFLLFY